MWMLLFLSPAEAQEKSAFEHALELDSQVQTQEYWSEFGGTRYRVLEYAGTKYYLRIQGREGEIAELSCQMPSGNQPKLVEGQVKIYKRVRFFIEALQENCESKNGHQKTTLELAVRFGFTIPSDPKDAIQNKKIYLAPRGLGFSGEF